MSSIGFSLQFFFPECGCSVRFFCCLFFLFKKRSHAFLSKEHPSFVKCNKNSGWHTGLVLRSEWKFSRAGDTTLDTRGSDSYQELNRWFFFFSLWTTWNTFVKPPVEFWILFQPVWLEFVSGYVTGSHNYCSFCPDLIRTLNIWYILNRFRFSNIFFWSPRDLKQCGNHNLLRKFLSTHLPPKCT